MVRVFQQQNRTVESIIMGIEGDISAYIMGCKLPSSTDNAALCSMWNVTI